MRFKEAQKMLTDVGFLLARVNGSHYVYKHEETGQTYVLPYPSGGSKDLHFKLVKKLKEVCSGIKFINGRKVT